MTNNEIIQYLKEQAEKNPATKAVFEVFCVRKRPRTTLTLLGLEGKMEKEGYKYPRNEYKAALHALAHVGIGQIVKDSKGHVTGLKGIKITFKSLGDAVIGSNKELKTFKQRNQFISITPHKSVIVQKPESLSPGITIGLVVNGHPVYLPVPKDLNSQDLATIIDKLKQA